jgi:hypothetical protein
MLVVAWCHHQCWLHGEDSHFAKLTMADVTEIRRRLALGHSQRDIARNFAISQSTISDINTGRSWRRA